MLWCLLAVGGHVMTAPVLAPSSFVLGSAPSRVHQPVCARAPPSTPKLADVFPRLPPTARAARWRRTRALAAPPPQLLQRPARAPRDAACGACVRPAGPAQRGAHVPVQPHVLHCAVLPHAAQAHGRQVHRRPHHRAGAQPEPGACAQPAHVVACCWRVCVFCALPAHAVVQPFLDGRGG